MCDVTAAVCLLWAMAAASARADVFYFNDEIDGFFKQFREDIKEANNTRFPLPNIHALYTKSMFFLGLHAQVNGTEGYVRDMSTIGRTSNVTIVTAKEYFVFRAEFGFDVLNIAYKYKAKFLGIPLKGDLDLDIGNNSIYIELLVNLTDNRCSGNVVTIRNLRFTKLDKISVKVSGFSLANRLMGYWLTRYFTDVSKGVTDPIEEGLKDFFKVNIKQFDFCQFGSVPANIPFDDTVSSLDVDDEGVNLPDEYNATSIDVNAILE